MRARDYRAQARAALKGHWFIVTLLVVLAMLLSAGQLSGINAGSSGLALLEYRDSFSQEAGTVSAGDARVFNEEMLEEMPDEELLEELVPVIIVSIVIFGVIFLAVMAYAVFLGSYVRVGLVNLMDRLHDGEKPRAGMLFTEGVYWRAVRLSLLRGLLVFLWSLLLVIPGIIASYRYSMADYLLLKHPEMGAREALRESKRRMKGRKWRKFCLEFSFIGWQLLCALPSVLGMTVFGTTIANAQGPLAAFSGMMMTFVAGGVSTIAAYFVQSYVNAAVVAFWREAQRCAGWHDEAREGADYAEETYGAEEMPWKDPGYGVSKHHAAPVETALNADETVARDMFFDYKCSRKRMQDAGVLVEYDALNASPISQMRWKREYADEMMRAFDQDAAMLDGLLDFASEYAAAEVCDRTLSRIERHIRQETLPDGEILNMAGRALAMVVSGVFADDVGFVSRKKQQVSDMADRLEHRLKEKDPEGAWNAALQLVRRMCA